MPILGSYEPSVKLRDVFEDKGQVVAQLVQARRFSPEGRGFD
jgi:hypothetical protein